jgi:hypothetical protein
MRVGGLNPDVDEIWSIWQTFGGPQQIISWTPYDWPPLYFLALGAWKELVGLHPDLLRFLSVLAFLPGVAALYRAALRMFGPGAALLAAIAYAALAYNIALSVLIRGYAFMVALTPLALWLTLNYFERPAGQPGIGRAAWLALCMAALFYTHLTAVIVFALLGLYTLIVYRRRLWRWWLPGLIAAILAAPLIAGKASLAAGRTASLQSITLLPPLEAFSGLFADYVGFAVPLVIVWGALFATATALILYRWRTRTMQAAVIALPCTR